MRKAVLISIRPKWCSLIASGKKTVEIRKTRPKIDTPFKCYIYCTKAQEPALINLQNLPETPYMMTCGDFSRKRPLEDADWARLCNGKVIGEFICDHIFQYTTLSNKDETDISDADMVRYSCISQEALRHYEDSTKSKDFCIWNYGLFGWHISELKIYDQPKELGEFKSYYGKCEIVDGYPVPATDRSIKRAPQSWMYVEENDG